MATSDQLGIAATAAEQLSETDLLIGISGPVSADDLRSRATEVVAAFAASNNLRIAVASPIATQAEAANTSTDSTLPLRFLNYPLSASATPALPWLAAPVAYREIARLADSTKARACVILSQDLASLDAATIEQLARPVLGGQAQLSVPFYPIGKYEGLLNSGMFYPLVRSLYGRQVRHPFAPDFAVAGSMLSRLANDGARNHASTIPCPVVDAAVAGLPISQSSINVIRARRDEVDLSTVLSALAGALFDDAERNATAWQRVRGSQPTPFLGSPLQAGEDGAAVDVKPLIESFNLGWRNLQEVWGLVLPPVSLLELKRLSRLPIEQFRMPDSLWAKIVYDFTLAHRLRSISRSHLLGALTPLYLGWVASYIAEVQPLNAAAVEERIEQLAAAYDEAKPYFVSRWRWPDRFNP